MLILLVRREHTSLHPTQTKAIHKKKKKKTRRALDMTYTFNPNIWEADDLHEFKVNQG